MGITAALGISLVGNFQETNVIVIHLIGALLAFVVGSIYCWIQTGMSFKMPDLPGNSVIVCRIRTVISVLTFIFIIMLFIFPTLSNQQAPSWVNVTDNTYWKPGKPHFPVGIFSLLSKLKKPKGESNLDYWNPSVPGYGFRITSTVSEWLVALLIVIFLATFYKEFRYFKLEKPTCSVHDRTKVVSVEQTGNEQSA
ncbi:DRAM2 [Mytilus edulis]|uniref:DRAM2 n=1 Tax=Mytilus edulis TaxID=6550 RepID=A0A8S3RR63_MYTED|nr:DRAM2 [Mytilus edulis]